MSMEIENSRRDFLKGSLLLGFTVPTKALGGTDLLTPLSAKAGDGKGLPTHYVEIQLDNTIYFTMDKAEMGQGVITGQTTLFGEEADIDPNRLMVRSAGVADVYGTMGGQQITGGSTSTKDRWMVLRQAGANVRDLMKRAAAKKWSVSADTLKTEDATVISADGKKIAYGELIAFAKELKENTEAPLKDPSEFKYIGKRITNVDASDKSLGKADFGIDLNMKDLLVAVVERCPTFGGKVKSFDAKAAMSVPGVKKIFEIPSGVAIVCEKYWQAKSARTQLQVEWDLGANKDLSSEKIIKKYQEKMQSQSGSHAEDEGDVDKALKQAKETLEAEYILPYLAHSTMEPMNCAAKVENGKCEVWSPNQAPTLIRNAVAARLGIDREKVTIHTTKYLGGGFGRRSTLDYSLEAVEIANTMKQPVKVVWSREDDTRQSPMRPLTVHKFKAAISDGQVTGWYHQLGCESILQQLLPGWLPLMLPQWLPGALSRGLGSVAGGAMETFGFAPTVAEGALIPYKVKNRRVEHYEVDVNLPIHFWRSVGHSYNGFVVESFVDEVALKLKQDPMEFRKAHLPKESRLRKALELVAEKSGWGKPLPEGRFRGIAAHTSFESHVAQVAEVEIVDGEIKVHKVYCAVDCGIAINPEVIEKQMESSIVYGLSATLSGEITIENGGIKESNFDDYPPMRISEAPVVETYIVESTQSPTGVGEPGLPPIAAAVSNAVFQATGQRLRSLPLRLS